MSAARSFKVTLPVPPAGMSSSKKLDAPPAMLTPSAGEKAATGLFRATPPRLRKKTVISASLPAGRSAMSLRLMSTPGTGAGASLLSEAEVGGAGGTVPSSASARRLKRPRASSAISDATPRRK